MVSATDYYPFGLELPGRVYSASEYSFGFNGKIEDTEILPDGRWQDYGFRAYRPDIGRFVSVDPLRGSYPELTTYQFASNSPVAGIDLDGLEFFYAADGTFLGQIGTDPMVYKVESSQIEIVSREISLYNTSIISNDGRNNLEQKYTSIFPVPSVDNSGMTNSELLTRATLSTIRYYEGHGTPLEYDILFGGSKFTDYSDHPDKVVITKNHRSSAAGAYQFMADTWFGEDTDPGHKKRLGLT